MRPERHTLPLAALLLAGSVAASAQTSDDLEVTMEIIDDLAALDSNGFVTERPDEASLFELDPGSEETDEDAQQSLFDQFTAMDGEFRILNEDDGFETDAAESASRRALETEGNFEAGEDIELDLVEDPMAAVDDLDP